MYFNYLKLSLRLLARNPFFTLINVLGLSIGFSVFLILWQYSQNELKSDRMWRDWERIGRVGLHWSFTDDGQIWEETPCVASPAMIVPRLKDDFREIEDYTRFIYLSSYRSGRGALISFESGSQRAVFKEERIAFADANLFTFFGIPFIYGEAVKSLPNGNSVCISRSTARKYFGEKNPLGEILTLNDTLPLQVTGVFPDLPTNSHLQFNIVISNQHHLKQWAISSLDPLVQSYIKAQSPVDWPRLEAKMNDSKEKYYGEAMRTWKNGRIRTLLQPLEDVAFDNRRFTPFKAKSKPMLIAFAATGIAVLIIAWINYIILTLSRAKKRMKEVATRKVSGASFKDFASQFIMESFVLNAFSLAFGITLLQFVSGSVILLFGIPFKGFGGMDAWSILTLLTTFLAGILTTGLYPALMSARYHPRALFNIGTGFSKNERMITLLTTGQYVSAIVLILWGFITYEQLDHVITKSTGAVSDAIVVFEAPIIRSDTHLADMEHFANQLGSMAAVLDKTVSRSVMGEFESSGITVIKAGSEQDRWLDSSGGVDENFIPFYNIKMIAGRNFVTSDRDNVIILSEGALLRLGFPDPSKAIGVKLRAFDGREGWVEVEIIGVIAGYRQRPFLFSASDMDKADRGIGLTYKSYLSESFFPERIAVKVDHQNVQAVVSKARKDFDALFPGNIFNWYWLNEHVARHYNNAKTDRNQIILFTCIAIGIACLGLLGMMSHKVIEKTKEIGIRKILGARLRHIAYILLNGTVKQVMVATVIAAPVSYYLIQEYLARFTERIELQWWHYALPIMILMFIMFATIASVLVKAARSNPVEALKYE